MKMGSILFLMLSFVSCLAQANTEADYLEEDLHDRDVVMPLVNQAVLKYNALFNPKLPQNKISDIVDSLSEQINDDATEHRNFSNLFITEINKIKIQEKLTEFNIAADKRIEYFDYVLKNVLQLGIQIQKTNAAQRTGAVMLAVTFYAVSGYVMATTSIGAKVASSKLSLSLLLLTGGSLTVNAATELLADERGVNHIINDIKYKAKQLEIANAHAKEKARANLSILE